MRWRDVESSVLRRYAYQTKEKLLWLEFKRGGIYRYENVPAKIKKEFVSADSKGRCFNKRIIRQFKVESMGRYYVE